MKLKLPLLHWVLSGLILFILGVLSCLIIHLLQGKHKGVLFQTKINLLGIFPPSLWIPASCGLTAALVGILHPVIDQHFNQQEQYHKDFSSVVRCVTLFVGISQASAKLDFTSNFQLTISLAVMSLGLWYFFDQSLTGLILSCIGAVLASSLTVLLNNIGYYKFSHPSMIFWIPCIFFSGGVTMGLVARYLVTIELFSADKQKDD